MKLLTDNCATSGLSESARLHVRKLLWLGLLIAAIAYAVPGITRMPSLYDEGLVLVGADRILQGEVPFRDFWNTHPPGQIWIVAALFKVFGPSILVMRIYDVVLRACLALLFYWFARRIMSQPMAIVAFSLSLPWVQQGSFHGRALFPAILAIYLALAILASVLVSSPGKRTQWHIFSAGLLVSIGTLFRLDFGFYGFVAGGLLITASECLCRTTPLMVRLRTTCAHLFRFTAGGVLAVLAGTLVLTAQGVGLDRLESILITYPGKIFSSVRGLPMPPPGLKTLVYYVPVIICITGLMVGLVMLYRRKPDSIAGMFWCGIALFPLMALPHTRTRADLNHQIAIIMPAVILACALVNRLWRAKGWVRGSVLLMLPVIYQTFVASWPSSGSTAIPQSRPEDISAMPRAMGVCLGHDQIAAVRAVQGYSAPDEAIYVGTGRHDKLLANDALFYFLAGRHYATAYHNLLPGLVTRADVQTEIAADLDRHAVRCIVLATMFDTSNEPNASSASGGVHLLDDKIRKDFRLTKTIGPYEIWTRP